MVVLGGYFAGSETGFSAMNKIRIKSRADDGDKKAKHAMYIANNFDKALTALLIGNNITHIAAASIATVYMTRLLEAGKFGAVSKESATWECTIITTAIVFLFSEMIPKSLANDRSETVALFFASSLRVFMKMVAPLVAFFSLITKFVLKLFSNGSKPSITEEELYDIIDTIEEEGVMNEEQSDLFKSALDFSETTAADVMTMKKDIVGVDINAPFAEILNTVKASNHTRLPVYDKTMDNFLGTIQIRVFLKEYISNPTIDVRSLITPPYFVSRDAKIDDLLADMRQHKTYLAVVGDKQNVYGIVTIEDFLEELVGEIWDEDDVVDNNFIKLGGNRFLINTKMMVRDAFDKIAYKSPDETILSKPVLSWVLETFGHFPEEDETFIFDKLEITANEIEKNKLISIIIKLNENKPCSENHDAAISDDNGEGVSD